MKGVGTEFYEDDIKSAESFIIDNVNLFDLQKMGFIITLLFII